MVLFGLQARPELNGLRGDAGKFNVARGRYEVVVDGLGGAARGEEAASIMRNRQDAVLVHLALSPSAAPGATLMLRPCNAHATPMQRSCYAHATLMHDHGL